MIQDYLYELIAKEFTFDFTPSQSEAVKALSEFVLTPPRQHSLFILRGYAGTGKTSIVAALVMALKKMKRDPILLAPTGRAAKVFASFANTEAYTIHKTIYRQERFSGENTHFSLDLNKKKHTLFIIDEASMIAHQNSANKVFGNGLLLDDLLRYVYSGDGCQLLFVGDTAQLPPVGEEDSPALNDDFMRGFGLEVSSFSLTEVVRQDAHSAILSNATYLRKLIVESPDTNPQIDFSNKNDLSTISGNELIEELEESYGKSGTEGTIVITSSNKRANIYNNGIRGRIFGREEVLTRGDLILIAKNNYYWAEKASKELPKEEVLPFTFIANGDIAEVKAIHGYQNLYGFQFADVTLEFHDYNNFELDVKVLLDTLQAEAPALPYNKSEELFRNVIEDYNDIGSKQKRYDKVRENPYYNAMQIKYAYALTCHKAQGGQWEHVFLDQGYIPPERMGMPYLRWLYTAFTRSIEHLYLINWSEKQTKQ